MPGMSVVAAGNNSPQPDRSTGASLPPRRKWIRRFKLLVILAVTLLVIGELVARFVLGLGDPPLLMADAEIQYLYQPNQDCRRQGNRVKYNAFSMRSDDFPASKTNPAEFRVIVIGDSVVNGGNPTDQADLATTMLAPMLSAKLSRPVVVGNISAGTWGPPNQLAYVRRFGLFDADVVAIVSSSHDAADVPRTEPIPGSVEKPWSALAEGLGRYSFSDLLHWVKGSSTTPAIDPNPPPITLDEKETAWALGDLKALIALARSKSARVIVLQYPDSAEVGTAPSEGYRLIKAAAGEAGAMVYDLNPAMKAALSAGPNPYRDIIHPNAIGQRVLAAELEKAILQSLQP